MEQFLEFLKYHIQLKPATVECVSEVSYKVNYKAGAPLLSPAETQETIYFIKEGVIRVYTEVDDYEWTSKFFTKVRICFFSCKLHFWPKIF